MWFLLDKEILIVNYIVTSTRMCVIVVKISLKSGVSGHIVKALSLSSKAMFIVRWSGAAGSKQNKQET